MFKDIVANKEVKFKDLEEKFFKLACSMVNEMFKVILEKYDEEIMNTRDAGRFRHKGKVGTSIKTKTGLIEYERVKYLEIKEDGTKQWRYLLDEELGITTVAGGHVSEGLIELIIKNISELSYRACSKMIEDCTGMSLSSVAIWNIIQNIGIKIAEFEETKVKAHEEEKLEAGEKVIPAVFQEADGIMIVMQGKDRKERIEKYEKEHPNEDVPKKVRNGELKMGMTYEGWKKEGKNRYKLIGKEYVAGFMDGEKMAEIIKANIYSKYDIRQIELNVTNSDGASWIKKLVPNKGIYQADTYHLLEKIKTHIREKEDAEEVIKMYWKEEYTSMIEYVEYLKYKYDGEYEEVIKLKELKKYLEKRKDCMRRYNTSKEMKIKLKEYSKNTGLEYRNMGCQESNNYAKLTRRFKRRRMSWTEKGATNLAKVITTYASESCENIFEYLHIKVLPEGFKEYAERYIREIEENVRKMKKLKKANKAPREESAIKHGMVKGHPLIRKMFENKEMSELIYR
jgi:hypothetical protein